MFPLATEIVRYWSCMPPHARIDSHGMARASIAASTRVVAHPSTPTAAMPTITMAG